MSDEINHIFIMRYIVVIGTQHRGGGNEERKARALIYKTALNSSASSSSSQTQINLQTELRAFLYILKFANEGKNFSNCS